MKEKKRDSVFHFLAQVNKFLIREMPALRYGQQASDGTLRRGINGIRV